MVPPVHLGPVDHPLQSAASHVDVGVDPHAPDCADRAFDQDRLDDAPRRIIAPNSIDWLIRISNECEREPAIQSTWRAEWCASCSRHSHRFPCCKRWNQ
jgi:hypothetical protein